MAYPFSEMPSFKDFRERLEKDHDCVFKDTENDSFPLSYFERIYNGKKLQCPVSFNNNDNDILTPTVLRYICRRLEVDPKPFGLYLE